MIKLKIIGSQRYMKCRIGDVVCGIEYGIEQCAGDEEVCIFCDITPCCRNCKNCSQHNTAADVGKQHPRTSLAHFCLGFVDQRTEYDIYKYVRSRSRVLLWEQCSFSDEALQFDERRLDFLILFYHIRHADSINTMGQNMHKMILCYCDADLDVL